MTHRRSADAPVWWGDHGHGDAKTSGAVAVSFEAWMDDVIHPERPDALKRSDVVAIALGPERMPVVALEVAAPATGT